MKNQMTKLGVAVASALCVTNAAVAGLTRMPNGGPTQSNNGAYTAHFTAAYFNGPGGFFTGAGERIAKTAPKALIKDSETEIITDLSTLPAGTYFLVGGSFISAPFVGAGWASDFDGRSAISGTMVVTDNGDGTGTLELTMYY